MRDVALDLSSEVDDGVGVVKNLERVLENLISLRLVALPPVEEPLVQLLLQSLEGLLLLHIPQLVLSVDHEFPRGFFGVAIEEVVDRLGSRHQVKRRRNEHVRVAVAETKHRQIEFPF